MRSRLGLGFGWETASFFLFLTVSLRGILAKTVS